MTAGMVYGPEVHPAVNVAAWAVVHRGRALLECVWPAWRESCLIPPSPRNVAISDGCCIHGAAFLASILATDVPHLAWSMVSGHPTERTPAGGYTDARGRSWQHCWVVGSLREHGREPVLLADITADQFEGPPALVARFPHPRYVANTALHVTAALADFQRPLVALLKDPSAAAAHLRMA